MGHIHLGVLPRTRRWREVVEMMSDGSSDDIVISASAHAAEKDFLQAANDPVFVEAVRLLAMIPVAARADDFGQALRDIDLPIHQGPDLFGLVAAVGQRLDSNARAQSSGNDFRELVSRALLATLTTQIGDRLPGLFDPSPADLQAAAHAFSAPRAFSGYARAFFTRLLSETLRYWLDRELCDHIGPHDRFQDAGGRSGFDEALAQFSAESTFIIKEFSAGWFGKTLHREGGIDGRSAAAFGAVAFRKITEELRLKRAGHV